MTLTTAAPTTVFTGRVLVVDDHRRARESIADVLGHAGHQVECCASAVEAIQKLSPGDYDLVITDLQMPGMSGLEFVEHLDREKAGVQMVMITAHASIGTAVQAMRHGVFDYIEKPFDVDQIEQLVVRAIEHGRSLDQRAVLSDATTEHAPAMIGSSSVMQALRERIAQIAPTSETVLITGESGTGKEVVARTLHLASRRGESPLVSLNCPVLSAQLMESELFGHERGAFTGAEAPRTGRFELAHGGTILLDEISEIELPLQAKLLRVLQEQTLERVGSSESIRVDVRVMATSNRDLMQEIHEGNFREDLYYRLAVVPLAVPPLRSRREDIPELTGHFLQRSAARLERDPRSLNRDALDLLSSYAWPGNVRELENIVTRASVLGTAPAITAAELSPWLSETEQDANTSAGVAVGLSIPEMERQLIEATLEHFAGHRGKTAQALGIGLRTLSGKLKSYGYAPREKPRSGSRAA